MPGYIVRVEVPSLDTAWSLRVDRHPDTCPRCHHGVLPSYQTGFFAPPEKVERARQVVDWQAVYRCPRAECAEFFFSWFAILISSSTEIDSSSLTRREYECIGAGPERFQEREFPEEVNDLSSDFVEIYNQPAAAEAAELQQVAGPGFRKALEFL